MMELDCEFEDFVSEFQYFKGLLLQLINSGLDEDEYIITMEDLSDITVLSLTRGSAIVDGAVVIRNKTSEEDSDTAY